MTEERKQQIANEVARYKECKAHCYCEPATASGYKVRCANCKEADEIAVNNFAAILEAITLYEKEGWVSVTERESPGSEPARFV